MANWRLVLYGFDTIMVMQLGPGVIWTFRPSWRSFDPDSVGRARVSTRTIVNAFGAEATMQ